MRGERERRRRTMRVDECDLRVISSLPRANVVPACARASDVCVCVCAAWMRLPRGPRPALPQEQRAARTKRVQCPSPSPSPPGAARRARVRAAVQNLAIARRRDLCALCVCPQQLRPPCRPSDVRGPPGSLAASVPCACVLEPMCDRGPDRAPIRCSPLPLWRNGPSVTRDIATGPMDTGCALLSTCALSRCLRRLVPLPPPCVLLPSCGPRSS